MMNTKNKISGEVNTLSLVVREYIARYCVTIASYMSDHPATPFDPAQGEYSGTGQAQKNNPEADAAHRFRINKNHLSLKGVTNK